MTGCWRSTPLPPLYDSGRMDEAAKAEARSILARMDYGDGGYFFAYDLQGALLVHPRTPERVGMNRLAYRLVVAAYNIPGIRIFLLQNSA